MRSSACLGLLSGLWCALASPAPRQEPGRTPVISVETDLVTLAVTVVDPRGRFVPGLSRQQFRVYDNGEPRAIELFTSEDLPATVGLVIDSSSSMRGRRDEVTAAAVAFAGFSHPLDELFTVNFNEAIWTGLPPYVPFAENVEQLRAALSRAPAQGMTALYDAVDVALNHLQLGTRDRRVLILVGDGGDNASALTLDRVVEHARRAGALIFSVMLADPDDREAKPSVLKKLARETGGVMFAPERVQGVMDAFTQIAREIRSGYTIGFSPPDSDGFRAVRVVVDPGDGRQLLVRTRTGYYAGRSRHGGG